MEQWVVNEVGAHGYIAVFALMVLGSACIPIPSEAVMLFGGALASDLVPRSGISWQDHLFGGLGGILAARVLPGAHRGKGHAAQRAAATSPAPQAGRTR